MTTTTKTAWLACLAGAVAMVVAVASTARADQSVAGTLSPGGVFCMASEFANSFAASGAANTLAGSPAVVKWSVWKGPSPVNMDTRIFLQTAPSFTSGQLFPGTWAQACINNTTSTTVTFTINQAVQ